MIDSFKLRDKINIKYRLDLYLSDFIKYIIPQHINFRFRICLYN